MRRLRYGSNSLSSVKVTIPHGSTSAVACDTAREEWSLTAIVTHHSNLGFFAQRQQATPTPNHRNSRCGMLPSSFGNEPPLRPQKITKSDIVLGFVGTFYVYLATTPTTPEPAPRSSCAGTDCMPRPELGAAVRPPDGRGWHRRGCSAERSS